MSNMLLFNKLVTLVPLTGVCLLSTSAPLFSRRAELETSPALPQEGAIWPTGDRKPGQWWITTTVSMHDSEFWTKFKEWQATLEAGRIYSVMIQPSTADGDHKTTLHSINITRDWNLDKIMKLMDERLAIMSAQYNSEFLGYTDIKFKDIGPYVPAVTTPRTLAAPAAETPVPPESPFGEPAFTTPAPVPAFPSYASTARPAAVRGTGGMDPLAQQIVAGLKPSLDDLKSSLHPVRGYEKLADTFASIVDRAIAPVANVQPSQPLPALVAPDPRVDSLVNSVTALESRIQSTPFEGEARLVTMFETLAKGQENLSGTVSTLAEGFKGLTTTMATLAKGQENLTTVVSGQGKTLETMGRILEVMEKRVTALESRNQSTPFEATGSQAVVPTDPDDSGDNGSSSPTPAPTPAPSGPPATPPAGSLTSPPMGTITLPAVMPAIHAPEPTTSINLNEIIAADLETLQGHGGPQTPFLCAWYGTPHNLGEKYYVFDAKNRTPEAMIKDFWKSLLTHCQGCTVYFHNWAGYDSIFTLAPLLALQEELNLIFEPIVRDGRVICLKIQDKKTRQVQLTVKDSMKLIPGALGKLAKDFGCETSKGHFPHYFNPQDHCGSVSYKGPIPDYKYFEAKRTSRETWEALASQYGDNWDFMEEAKKYLRSDCEALHQVLLRFFTGLNTSFQVNPINNLSIPGVAFRVWKQKMLPNIVEGVRDLSRQADPFRAAYHGGIVEVYRPHLTGEGYYYDVNSLYPTAMCKPIPVGEPKLINLTPGGLDHFFGYLWAKVKAPIDLYVGLLPIKYKGQLVCPGGTFTGFFFSEELKFALENGYQLLKIGQACQFVKNANTFKDLIVSLNQMKVKAQLAGESVKRNIAKLMMNSLYGRFGMHPAEGVATFVDQAGFNEIIETCTIISQIEIEGKYLIEYLPKAPEGPNLITKRERKVPKPRPMETNVPIAAAVTAYSRMIINGHKLAALELGHDLYYSDTDSLVVSGLMPDHLVDKAELGKLKLEDTIVEGIFPEVKVYWYKTTEGKEVVKCKGYHGSLTREEILCLTEGKVLELKMDRWYRFLSQGVVGINLDKPYCIDPQFRKRTKVFDSTGKWIDSRPLVLA